MPCSNTQRIKNGDLTVLVRCGKCTSCRIRNKQAWVGRLRLEKMDHFSGRFITLTYAEEAKQNAPLDYQDFQLFLKRYRYYHGPYRYFAVGEYGSKTGHAHWHALIFGHQQLFNGHWPDNKSWQHGYSFDGSITLESIGYVANYALKATVRSLPNITRMSLLPGIGFNRIEKLGQELAFQHPDSISNYPTAFRIGNNTYPLCDGARRHFIKSYLEAGGLPLADETPERRHVVALSDLADLGTRLQSERNIDNRHRGRSYVSQTTRERF